MITCASCGAANADGRQFCAACGEYLWDEGSPPPAPGPAVTRDRPVTDRSTDARTDPAVPAPPGPGPSTAGPPAPVAHPPGPGGHEPGGHEPVRAGDGTPQPLQPGAPSTTREAPGPAAAVDPASRPPEPELTCAHCGRGNPPNRRICRFCGESLTAPVGPAPERATWWERLRDRWRRLWDRVRRRGPRRPARKDRRAAGAARRLLLLVLGLCLVGVLAVAGPPLARRAVEAVRDRTEDPASLVPAAVSASSEKLGAGAARLTDGASNRYWAPTGTAAGAWVEGRFTEPVRLLTVIITPGVGERRQAFLEAGRPRGLTVVTVDADGKQEKTDIELRDEPGEQQFPVEAANVVRIRLVVRSTYGPGLDPAVAIGEAEFFGRR
ncbi:zinc ribbon domain-containing protein [Micromonospora sp. NBC_01655]|uniref:zinc ribbon domain-containing protein n=1 Tax=Micromonospora sp. NBC_01655 TaxID=2975983 RepID=UPI00225BF0F4|nr:zinc ribbon domain-containing protein [Micromonospora sp. NBC_01655]MCX4473548.1 zinc ribbon domain-containing protein [Micromonospora sp. NBC_01655]